MTTSDTPGNHSFHDLAMMHSELCAAGHHLHLAWDTERKATGQAANSYSDAVDMVHQMADRVYKRFRSHPEHPLNSNVTDIPLAKDTTPSAPPLRLSLADYTITDEHGNVVRTTDEVTDFRGDKFEFVRLSRAPMAGKSAKVTVLRNGQQSEFYAHVFNLTVS